MAVNWTMGVLEEGVALGKKSDLVTLTPIGRILEERNGMHKVLVLRVVVAQILIWLI